ncbi:hypothetical protein [Palleronia pelagia]|uniref:Uncharacterized protein n=1 Tax=Palleronia pelagia TaxID=387096 RepID=A0A1H8F961_9RHOB|nr:hypothetical protein SAMN04488011_103241 [Palleronia pelagia]
MLPHIAKAAPRVATTRRGFLAGATGLVIATHLPGKSRAQAARVVTEGIRRSLRRMPSCAWRRTTP